MPDINFSIKIVDSKGRPIPNIEVSVYDNANLGESADSGHKNSEGWIYLQQVII